MFIARKDVTMRRRLQCLPKRTAKVRERDYMKIRKLGVHAGRTGSVSRLLLYPSNSPQRIPRPSWEAGNGRPMQSAHPTHISLDREGWEKVPVAVRGGKDNCFFRASSAPTSCANMGKTCHRSWVQSLPLANGKDG